MTILAQLIEPIGRGDRQAVRRLVTEALERGIPPSRVLAGGLIRGMDVVGERFQAGELYIPHLLLAARAMQAALEILRPRLVETGAQPVGRVVLGTVRGDHHDIGKNLVRMMLEGKGFEVIDLGVDVPPASFAAAVTANEGVRIVAMSSLLSTTAPFLGETVEVLRTAGVRDRVKVLVGGGVVTQETADRCGADAYGPDAAAGAETALRLLAGS